MPLIFGYKNVPMSLGMIHLLSSQNFPKTKMSYSLIGTQRVRIRGYEMSAFRKIFRTN